MRFSFYKIIFRIKKNLHVLLLIFLVIISATSMKIYNVNKENVKKSYTNLINNIYFKKSLNHIFNNLKPKYVHIDHKVLSGETFNQILSLYEIPKEEINKIKKILKKKII